MTGKNPADRGTGHGNALKEIGFISISEKSHRYFLVGLRLRVTSVARSYGASAFVHAVKKGPLQGVMKEKENIGPKRRNSPGISAYHGIRWFIVYVLM